MTSNANGVKRSGLTFDDLTLGNGFFLSKSNPIATVDQRELEALAIQINGMPQIEQAKKIVGMRWKTMAKRDLNAEAESRFEELIEEYAFNYIMKVVNSDPNYPKVLGHNYGPPHSWFGMNVPGSRGSGGDGPDQNYSIIPIDGQAKYRVLCRCFDRELGDVPFTLTGNLSLSMTIGQIEWRDMNIDSDGTFTVTLDPEPVNGRKNHIQTTPDSRWLFIRDCRSDWKKPVNAYRVERLDPPSAPPLTVEQMANRAARFMIDDVPTMYWFISIFNGLEANEITNPFDTGGIAGLVSQQICFIRLKLKEDEAFVATLTHGGAPFRDIVVHDFWFRTLPYWEITSSRNNAQSVADSDGRFTYVFAHNDPGVHNWLDVGGFENTLVVHRWQSLPKTPDPSGPPMASGKIVKLCDLDSELPDGIKRVTLQEREEELRQRAQDFRCRYLDS